MLYLESRKTIDEENVEYYTKMNGGCSFFRGEWFTNYEPSEITNIDNFDSLGIIIPKTKNSNEVLKNINTLLNVPSSDVDYHVLIGTWYSNIENRIMYDESMIVNIDRWGDSLINNVKKIGKILSQEAMGIIVNGKGLLIVE